MIRMITRYVAVAAVFMLSGGCEAIFGPDRTGEIQLSSQFFGSESYYLFGYSYETGEFYRYPYQGEPIPDIINEAFRVIVGGEVGLLPGFNTPGKVNGFALVGEFETLESGRTFYEEYDEVESDLQFEVVSDTVELYQVWVQKTSIGNYVKLFVKGIENLQGESGNLYNELSLEYTYQPDGSTVFND